jgi:hypothetical protein
MITTTNTDPHEIGAASARTPIFCEKTGKLLARIDTMSAAQLAGVQGGLWCWCRGCHAEHHIPWETIAHQR